MKAVPATSELTVEDDIKTVSQIDVCPEIWHFAIVWHIQELNLNYWEEAPLTK